jgi:hypothetical protein
MTSLSNVPSNRNRDNVPAKETSWDKWRNGTKKNTTTDMMDALDGISIDRSAKSQRAIPPPYMMEVDVEVEAERIFKQRFQRMTFRKKNGDLHKNAIPIMKEVFEDRKRKGNQVSNPVEKVAKLSQLDKQAFTAPNTFK